MDTTTDTPADPPPIEDPIEAPIEAPRGAALPQPTLRSRLVRSTDDRILGGVAGGIAESYGIEPLLVRLAFILAAFFGGIGVIAYLVGWVVLPSAAPSLHPAPRDNRQLIGFGLVAVGLAIIPSRLGFGWAFASGSFWPLALIALGGAVLWLRTRDDHDDPAEPPAPPAAGAAPARPADTVAYEAPVPPDGDAGNAAAAVTAAAPAAEGRRRRPPRTPRVKTPRGPVTAITLSALLVLAGVAWLVDSAGWATLDVGAVAAVALVIVGGGLVASAWIGRARGLVVLAVLLTLVVGALGAIDVPVRGGIGDATYRPHDAAAVHDHYEMAIGRLTLDFVDTDLAGRRTTVDASVGLGGLAVRVPDDVRLVARGHAGAGAVTLLGRHRNQCCPTDERLIRPGVPAHGTLVLDVRVGAGAVDVTTQESSHASS